MFEKNEIRTKGFINDNGNIEVPGVFFEDGSVDAIFLIISTLFIVIFSLFFSFSIKYESSNLLSNAYVCGYVSQIP